MNKADLSHIAGIVWDLDNTLYRYDHIFIEACNIAAARTAIDLGLDMPFEDALVMARESEINTGSSFSLFAQFGLKYEDFHHPYHEAVDTTVIAKNLEMKDALTALNMPMVILTNASRHWARKTIDHIELDVLFPDAKLIALEDAGYEPKARGPRGFNRALELLGTNAAQTLMVEDLARNLPHAKNLGMTTALVRHGKEAEHAPHVDHIFDDALTLARAISLCR